jgi:Dolichyl-phosphate-mannose-protein mannosyltransferase
LTQASDERPRVGTRTNRFRAWDVTTRSRWALVAIISFAAIVRLILYASDRSLTLDESFLALNVDRRSAADLLGRLDWNTAAPFAFLELEKLMTVVFGHSEHVLRAVPFLGAVVGLFVFARLATRVSSARAAVLAGILFAASALTISYAALAKPYSLDLLFVMLVELATLRALSDPPSSRSLLMLGLLGAIAPAFSYASVFAVAGTAVVLVASAIRTHQASVRTARLALVAAWGALALTWYLWHGETVRHLQRSFGAEYLESWDSIRDAIGAVRILLGVSVSTAELGTFVSAIASVAALSFLCIGLVHLVRKDWQIAATLLLPGVAVAAAAVAKLYPLTPRTMLFLVPAFLICIAHGILLVWGRAKASVLRVVVVALAAAVMISEASAGIRAFAPIRRDDGLKPIMAIVAQHELSKDTVYLSYASQYPFAYYLRCRCGGSAVSRPSRSGLWDVVPVRGSPQQFSPALRSKSSRFIIGTFRGYRLASYLHDLPRLRGRGRVWIITTFLHKQEREQLRLRLDRLGTRIASYGDADGVDAVTADLYDF